MVAMIRSSKTSAGEILARGGVSQFSLESVDSVVPGKAFADLWKNLHAVPCSYFSYLLTPFSILSELAPKWVFLSESVLSVAL